MLNLFRLEGGNMMSIIVVRWEGRRHDLLHELFLNVTIREGLRKVRYLIRHNRCSRRYLNM
jgi:hypothetical protein